MPVEADREGGSRRERSGLCCNSDRTVVLTRRPAAVVPLTSNLDRAVLAGNVALNAPVTGLRADSAAVPLGLELVDCSWLVEAVGQLPGAHIDAIDEGLRAVLDL